jgi:lipopolysaccharide/colanic/teichoic acid biosynthesis glycosyltransferase
MRRFVLLIADVALMVLATLMAFILRDNFEVSATRLWEFLPYLLATALATIAVFPAAGLNRTVWRFAALPDYMRVIGALAAAVCVSAVMGFAYNRLDGVPRSLPVLQLLAGYAIFTGARALHKLRHMSRENRKASAALLEFSTPAPMLTVLVVGISRLTEAYLQAAAELAPRRIRIAGLAGRRDHYAGRLVASYPVLGIPEDIEQILNALDVHGIHADRIVVATRFEALSPEARLALLCVKNSRNIALHFLAEDLGFEEPGRSTAGGGETSLQGDLTFDIPPSELTLLAARPYWRVKRAIDAIIALSALIVCTPFMLLTAICVAASMGFPVVFWQQRPGLGGRPFRLYKFRTMRTHLSPSGRRLADWERTTLTGHLLRRLRMDELPQLINILRGDMSFVGPRPLLAREQQDSYRARLLVRPGLAGWAQAVGGRTISFEDKAALDVWYVRNASMALDIQIFLRTIPIILFGERVSNPLIEQAWNDLGDSGIIKGELMNKIKDRIFEMSSQV